MGGRAERGVGGGAPVDAALDAAIGTAFYQSPVAMACADSQARTVRANKAFCELLGLPADEVIGRRPSEFARGFDSEFIERTVIEQVFGRGEPLVDARLTQRFPDGGEQTLSWSAFLLVDGA